MYYLAILVSIFLLQSVTATAQSLAALPVPHQTPSDSVSCSSTPSSGYIHIYGGLADDLDRERGPFGSAFYKYSSAQANASTGFGFTAELGATLVSGTIGLSGGIGTEMVNNGFVLGATAGFSIAPFYQSGGPYTEISVGYEFPLGNSDSALRIQGGPIAIYSFRTIVMARGGIGLVFR